jgi:hypothetical protein
MSATEHGGTPMDGSLLRLLEEGGTGAVHPAWPQRWRMGAGENDMTEHHPHREACT